MGHHRKLGPCPLSRTLDNQLSFDRKAFRQLRPVMLGNSGPLSPLTNQRYKVDTTAPAQCTRIPTINECQSSQQEVVEDERVVELSSSKLVPR